MPCADAELDDGEMEESVTRLRGRDFDIAEVHTFHTDRFGKSLSIEEYFKSEAKKGPCSTVDVSPLHTFTLRCTNAVQGILHPSSLN
jgi:hypothetical protein